MKLRITTTRKVFVTTEQKIAPKVISLGDIWKAKMESKRHFEEFSAAVRPAPIPVPKKRRGMGHLSDREIAAITEVQARRVRFSKTRKAVMRMIAQGGGASAVPEELRKELSQDGEKLKAFKEKRPDLYALTDFERSDVQF